MKNFDGFFPPENSREVNTKWDSLSYTFNLFHIKVSPLCLDNFFKPEVRKPLVYCEEMCAYMCVHILRTQYSNSL